MMASSGMTFSFVPACNAPMVTTAASAAATSRDTMVCRRMHRRRRHDDRIDAGLRHRSVRAASEQANLQAVGGRSDRARHGLRRSPTGPTMTCWPRTTSGLGKRLNSPSSIMACAPSAVSSAGLEDRHQRAAPRRSWPRRAIWRRPTSQVTCISWPHMCETGTVLPSRSMPVTLLAYGRPGRFLDGQRVHIGAQHDRRPVAVAKKADDAGLADARRDFIAGGTKTIRRQVPRCAFPASRVRGANEHPCRGLQDRQGRRQGRAVPGRKSSLASYSWTSPSTPREGSFPHYLRKSSNEPAADSGACRTIRHPFLRTSASGNELSIRQDRRARRITKGRWRRLF